MIQRPFPIARLHLRPVDVGQPDPAHVVPIWVRPISFKVTRNDHRDADTCELTFSHEDFPFDPRILRGANIALALADSPAVAADEFWASIDENTLREQHALFLGVADDVEAELGEDGRYFRLRGRDYTAYFLDAEFEGTVQYGTKTFREVIEAIIYDPERPETHQLEVDTRGEVFPFRPADYRATELEQGEQKKQAADESVWEALQRIALEAGYIVYVDLHRFVIQEPKVLNPDAIDHERLWLWTIGWNLSRVQYQRRLGRQHGLHVQVTSMNPRTGVRLKASASDEDVETEIGAAAPITQDATGKPKAKRNVIPFVVPGIVDQDQLQRIADALLEQLRHYELEATLETSSMYDSQGKPVWQLRYSDPVAIDISENLVGSILIDPPSVQIQKLVEIGFEIADAEKLLRRQESFDLPFILDSVTYNYSTRGDEGFSVEITVRSRKSATLEGAPRGG